jgi:hypothetical protein
MPPYTNQYTGVLKNSGRWRLLYYPCFPQPHTSTPPDTQYSMPPFTNQFTRMCENFCRGRFQAYPGFPQVHLHATNTPTSMSPYANGLLHNGPVSKCPLTGLLKNFGPGRFGTIYVFLMHIPPRHSQPAKPPFPLREKSDCSGPLLLPPCQLQTKHFTGVLKYFGRGRYQAYPGILQAHISKPLIHQPSMSPLGNRVGHGRPLLFHVPFHQSICRRAKEFRPWRSRRMMMNAERSYLGLKCYPEICLEKLRKTKK